MFRRLRELGPPVLVPVAWAFVTVTHLDLVSDHTVFVAHVVMAALLAGFVATGRADMQEGVLGVWWRVIVVGFVVTSVGVVGFQVDASRTVLLGVALGGWMTLPAIGFVYTGKRVTGGAWIYFGGAAACLVGVALYAVGSFGGTGLQIAGLVCVGIGQTVGILDAALRY